MCRDTALMHVVCTIITALKYYHIACFVSGLLQMSVSNTGLMNNSFSLSVVKQNHPDSSRPTKEAEVTEWLKENWTNPIIKTF